MFLDLSTGLLDLGVHRSEYRSDVAITNLDTLDVCICALFHDLDEVLEVFLLTLLPNSVEDESWYVLLPYTVFGLEFQHLFSRFPDRDTRNLTPEILGLKNGLIVDLSEVGNF